jgi:hypothetical protein
MVNSLHVTMKLSTQCLQEVLSKMWLLKDLIYKVNSQSTKPPSSFNIRSGIMNT